jgi:hypothetical protein
MASYVSEMLRQAERGCDCCRRDADMARWEGGTLVVKCRTCDLQARANARGLSPSDEHAAGRRDVARLAEVRVALRRGCTRCGRVATIAEGRPGAYVGFCDGCHVRERADRANRRSLSPSMRRLAEAKAAIDAAKTNR